MWNWLSANSLWILIASAILVVIILFFGDKVRGMLSHLVSEKKREAAGGRIRVVFWTLEGLFVLIMIGSFITMVLTGDGDAPIVTSEDIKQWLAKSGVAIIIILLVGVVLWSALKRLLPPLVSSFMARPIPGESQEGIKRRAKTLTSMFLGLSRILIVIIAILMILSETGINIGPILAGFGIVGIAVGFGAQYLIKDLIAGVFILLENQYRIGDVARLGDISGTVEEINLRKTVIRDIDGAVHHIPNGEIRIASNLSRHFARVNLNIAVAYDTDLDHAIGIINRVCAQMSEEEQWKKIFRTVPKVLRVDKLGDSGIEIKITGDVKPLEQWNAMGEMRLRLKKAFDKEKIEIPFPHTKIYFGNEPGDARPFKQ